jgi:hypothetical protein
LPGVRAAAPGTVFARFCGTVSAVVIAARD